MDREENLIVEDILHDPPGKFEHKNLPLLVLIHDVLRVTIPQKDILSGVDQLINDGIADRTKLTIGGYSYGGILTNWIITQTTRFNAALSGAGSIEQTFFWGLTDSPTYLGVLLGGLPWTTSNIYQNQSVI